MYNDWSNEDLLKRFLKVSNSYVDLANKVTPMLSKIYSIEKELKTLSEEINKRGIENASEETS